MDSYQHWKCGKVIFPNSNELELKALLSNSNEIWSETDIESM